MDIGKLDRRVTLMTVTRTKDTNTGEEVESFTAGVTVWGQKLDITGKEFFSAGQINAEVNTKFIIRHRSDVTPDMKLRCESVDYDIMHPPIELGRHQWLQILARKRVQ
jgi:SPP1 family predicted phage head-tail adaptor